MGSPDGEPTSEKPKSKAKGGSVEAVKIGILGPTDDDDELREAASFLLGDAGADQVVFMGDGAFLEEALERWLSDLGLDGDGVFLDRALEVARSGDPRIIEAFLAEDAAARRILDVRRLPEPPARAVELIDGRIVLFVHDKSVLDEDDIANANLIVYGASSEAGIRKFGRRSFFTPGPLSAGRVGLIETNDEGLTVAVYDVSGMPVLRETLAQPVSRMTVSS